MNNPAFLDHLNNLLLTQLNKQRDVANLDDFFSILSGNWETREDVTNLEKQFMKQLKEAETRGGEILATQTKIIEKVVIAQAEFNKFMRVQFVIDILMLITIIALCFSTDHQVELLGSILLIGSAFSIFLIASPLPNP